jgi:hypothetical protein
MWDRKKREKERKGREKNLSFLLPVWEMNEFPKMERGPEI